MNGQSRAGLGAGIFAYFVWGLIPILFKALSNIAAGDVLAWRVLWSLVMCLVLVVGTGRLRGVAAVLKDWRTMGLLTVSAAVIAGNWLVYIHAVTHDHVLDASLGYFINPLISVLFGVTLLRERLDRAGWAAVALALAGVAVLAAERGALPWISLVLAVSFAVYGLIRKQVPVQPMIGLFVETAVLTPPALLWLIGWGGDDFGNDHRTDLLLLLSGPATAVPLMMFAFAARRLKLATLGLLQYIAPTLVFLLGAFAYHEPLDTPQVIAFAAIWSGVVIYAVDSARQRRTRLARTADNR